VTNFPILLLFLMKNKKEYVEHLKERWGFSLETAEKELGQKTHVATNLALSIFDKCASPYYFFVEDREKQNPQPSEAQVKYAKSLKIEKPETYTRKELSQKIKEMLAND